MQCHEFENRLNVLLDERRVPESDPQLAAHAAECEECGRALAGQAALLGGLASLCTPELPANFSECVVAQVVEPVVPATVMPATMPARSRGLWWVVGAAATVAAVLVLAVNVGIMSRRHRDRAAELANQSPTAVQRTQREKQPRPRGLATINPGPAVKQPEAAPRPTPRAAPPQVARTPAPIGVAPSGEQPQPLGMSLSAYRLSLENMAAGLPEAALRIDEMERIAPGIRPIRVSLVVLWDALRRAIPGMHPSEAEPARTSWHFWESTRVA
jgi:hypothetical protein